MVGCLDGIGVVVVVVWMREEEVQIEGCFICVSGGVGAGGDRSSVYTICSLPRSISSILVFVSSSLSISDQTPDFLSSSSSSDLSLLHHPAKCAGLHETSLSLYMRPSPRSQSQSSASASALEQPCRN